jgi:hypothetical protein
MQKQIQVTRPTTDAHEELNKERKLSRLNKVADGQQYHIHLPVSSIADEFYVVKILFPRLFLLHEQSRLRLLVHSLCRH